MLMENKNYTKTLALKKRLWTGEEGAFAKKNLQEYYKVYNQTQLNTAKDYIMRVRADHKNKMKIGFEVKNIKK